MSKSKAPLVMLEQMVMLLVFALAAALCLQAFVKSDSLSRASEARDRAALLCQSVAEELRLDGDIETALTRLHGEAYEQDGVYHSFYDEDWNYIGSIPGCGTGKPEAVYRLEVQLADGGAKGLGMARVEAVSIQDGTAVFSLEVAWQTEVRS